MKLIGLLIVRNEAWCLRTTLEAIRWVDAICILIHASTDKTQEVVERFARVTLSRRAEGDATWPDIEWHIEESPSWDEATYRARLLRTGRDMGGTHFAIIDGDELLTANAARAIRDKAASLAPGDCLRLPWLQCWRGLDAYRSDDSTFGRAFAPVVFADAPHLSYSPDGDGYQLHTRAPRGVRPVEFGRHGDGGLLHLQHANWRRLISKQLWYELTETLRWGAVRARYIDACNETGLQTTPIPADWWPADKSLIDLAAEPWQVAECRRLVAEHGVSRFADCKVLPLAIAEGIVI